MRAGRITDIVLVLVTLPLWLPLLLATAAVVACGMGRPVLFRQLRAGLQGEPFELVKFRSMTEERDRSGVLLSDEQRLTRLGRWLRATSLDELPELWNVLKGDMSLVGPRPLPVVYVARYNARQRRRLEVPPGITGWAQIRGRNALDWEARFEHDLWYVENRSWALDLKILLLTIWVVLCRRGISAPGEATMGEFMGSPADPSAAPEPPAGEPADPGPARKSE